jgi:excinuclease ABC subunit B
VRQEIPSLRDSIWEADYVTVPTRGEAKEPEVPVHELPALIADLRREMAEASRALEFERAAVIRDRIQELDREWLARK